VGRSLGCGLLALALTVPAVGAALADDAPDAAPSPSLTLVTLQGAGTTAGRHDAGELLARRPTW
jgi:hypothetical protein